MGFLGIGNRLLHNPNDTFSIVFETSLCVIVTLLELGLCGASVDIALKSPRSLFV